jgi:hypothetical protein
MGLQSRSEYIGEGLTKNSMYNRNATTGARYCDDSVVAPFIWWQAPPASAFAL